MAKYFYLLASLPDLELEKANKNLDFEAIFDLVKRNLSEEDLRLFQYLLYPNDIKNIISEIAAKREKPSLYPAYFFPSHIAPNSLKNTSKIQEVLPGFFASLFEQHPEWLEDKQLPKLENIMLERFYESALNLDDKFISKYFEFDRNLRNILVACNARNYSLNLESQLIGDADINRQLQRSQASDFGLSQQFPFIDEIFLVLEKEEPVALEKLLDKLRWGFIDDYNALNFFERGNVYGYFMKLMMTKRWTDLEGEETPDRLGALIEDSMKSLEIPEIFTGR